MYTTCNSEKQTNKQGVDKTEGKMQFQPTF